MSNNNLIKLDNEIIVAIRCFFKKNLEIDYKSIKKFILFLLKKNIKIFYLARSASELEFLSYRERITLAKFVKKIIKSKKKLFFEPLEKFHIKDQIKEAKKLQSIGCSCLVISPIYHKSSQYFFSNKFKKADYLAKRHNKYYIEYMQKICKSLRIPIIFCNTEFQNKKTLNTNCLNEISKIKNIFAIKEHCNDLKLRIRTYNLFNNRKNFYVFDGFSKNDFIKYCKKTKNVRMSNFSWFDLEFDFLFTTLLKNKKYKLAKELIKLQKPIEKIIIKTGYAGYKQLVKEQKIVNVNGYTRSPGGNLTKNDIFKINKSFKQFNKKKKIFLNKCKTLYDCY